MKKLRLLLTKDCDRSCKGCCNKDWDLEALETVTAQELGNYDEILVTGGEPLLYPQLLLKELARIRAFSLGAKLIVYTAKTDNIGLFVAVNHIVDGMTLTLHTQKDVAKLQEILDYNTRTNQKLGGSLRINIFKNIDYSSLDLNGWIIKDNMVWIKDCPLPENEVFKKI